jgi:hypothetical protein
VFDSSLPMWCRALCCAAVIVQSTLLGGCSGKIEPAQSTVRDARGVDGSGSAANARPSAAAAGANGANGGDPSAPLTLAACAGDAALTPGRAPLRRLTRFELDNTVRDLLADDSHPAEALPSEELGNGFGNDADAQAVSSLLAEQYSALAETVAARATETPAALARLAPCAAELSASSSASEETTCARTVIAGFARRAYRRPLETGEADELLALQQALREGSSFASSIAAVIEAVLQSPELLYRLEWGVPEPGRSDVLRPSGPEMATRLAYLLWGTMPDDALAAAAERGELSSAQGVLAAATRMLDDPRAKQMVRFFFDNLLPISGLAGLERDRALFPGFTPPIGALMREETQRFLKHEIFDGPGSWRSALTAPYTFVNGPLAKF